MEDCEPEYNKFPAKKIEIVAMNFDIDGNILTLFDGDYWIITEEQFRHIAFSGWFDHNIKQMDLSSKLTFVLKPEEETVNLTFPNGWGFNEIIVLYYNYDGCGGAYIIEDGEIGYTSELDFFLHSGHYTATIGGKQIGRL